MSKDVFKQFDFDLQNPNVAYTLTTDPQTIASVKINSDSDSFVVKLAGTVGWLAISKTNFDFNDSVSKADVVFEIWRNHIGHRTPIYIARDSAQATNPRGRIFDNFRVTSLGHVDANYSNDDSTTYYLTARLGNSSASDVLLLGPLTFSGTGIDT